MTDPTTLLAAERESGMTVVEALAYTDDRLHAWRLNVPDRIPKEMRALRVLAAALRALAQSEKSDG